AAVDQGRLRRARHAGPGGTRRARPRAKRSDCPPARGLGGVPGPAADAAAPRRAGEEHARPARRARAGAAGGGDHADPGADRAGRGLPGRWAGGGWHPAVGARTARGLGPGAPGGARHPGRHHDPDAAGTPGGADRPGTVLHL
ncbi:MAG: hypothetical protein AVDCRST_MAG77-2488, partial [uncultured Chloroflexi bacterium]